MITPIRDVDGDGIDDFIITAPEDGVLGTPSGRVYIYSGATRQVIRTFMPHVPDIMYYGATAGALWDFNGDGRGDIVIASPQEPPPPGGQISGRAHIYSGATGELLTTIADHGQGSFCGIAAVFALPDINGDGRSDVALNYDYLGCVYTQARSSADGSLLYQFPAYGWGSDPIAHGHAVMPDLDGDGVADLALGMPWMRGFQGDPRRGRVYIVSGATGDLIREIHSPLWMSRWFGFKLDVVDDVDGDGVPDLIVGDGDGLATPESPSRSGVAFLFSGATGALIHTIAPPVPLQSAFFGNYVAGIPDIDGDGRGDVVVTAFNDSPPGLPLQSGAAYVFSGGTGQLLRTLHSPNAEYFRRFGESVSRFPESRPSRRATIAVGAPTEWGSRGRVYLFAACKADANADGEINANDVAHFLSGWLLTVGAPPQTPAPPGVHHGDYDGDGIITSRDISAFLKDWILAIHENGCP